MDALLALRHSVTPLVGLDRERDVWLPPIEGEHWTGRVIYSRGSFRDDTSHCLPDKKCGVRRVYEPSSLTMVVDVYVNPEHHLRSERLIVPRQIGPLFIDASVAVLPTATRSRFGGA